jgi:sugar phosphate isomerase/epimerase
MVRDGYWAEPANVASTLPRFVKEMESHGVRVDRASTSYPVAELADLSTGRLQILRDAGIAEFRTGWFPRPRTAIREALDQARMEMEALAASCESVGIRAVYQVHHDKLIQSPTAAFHLVKDLPSRYVAVELDPGNQTYEGYEAPEYAVDLLGDSLAWFACKDTYVWQEIPRSEEPGKGWERAFCPVYDGVVDWQRQLNALAERRFRGTVVLMPFYEPKDPIARTSNLKREVDYLKALAETSRLR